MQPLVIFSGGITNFVHQPAQSNFFANTVFEYHPQQTSEINPIIGGFIGAEYLFNQNWAWQFGLAFYQIAGFSVSGVETQAPLISLDAINVWDYQYKIARRQLLFENKLLLAYKQIFHPYLLVGLGGGFNKAYGFQVTPQNAGEVATATFANNSNNGFIYLAGVGLDIDVLRHIRLGIGYRFGYLGTYNLGNGTLDTGIGGSVFSLPALQSTQSFNQEVLIQLTYLFEAPYKGYSK